MSSREDETLALAAVTALTGQLALAPKPGLPDPRDLGLQLRALTWLNSAPRRWPGFFPIIETALRQRGLVPERRIERPREAPTMASALS